MRKNGKIVKCIECGNEYYLARYRLKETRFCSNKCRYENWKNKGEDRRCLWCGKSIHANGIQVRRNRGKFCNKEHYNLYYEKDGISQKADGYILLFNRNHHESSKRGTIRQHRFVAEQCLGRYLKRTEIIHHINENKSDNQPYNLYLFSSLSEHRRYHGKPHPLFSNIIILIK